MPGGDQLLIHPLESTVDLLDLHRAHPRFYPHLLESAIQGTPQARYDILFASPLETLSLTDEGLKGRETLLRTTGFTEALDSWWQEERQPYGEPGCPWPFRGGWFLFLGYELAGELEPSLRLPADPQALPVAVAVRCPCAVINDHRTGKAGVICEPGFEDTSRRIRADIDASRRQAPGARRLPHMTVEEDPSQRYLDGVLRVKDYIYEGDVFQVNLSRAWHAHAETPVDEADLYEHLRQKNPAPFAALATFGDYAIISSSPERLVAVRSDSVETRPIAGTSPRDQNRDRDAALSTELLAHPKERAEHIMLIDLERNDLGRVCVPGSVKVGELMVLESYRHVHHIVSKVGGRLRPDITPGAVIRAVFPGGTITGCPKVRCMEIIAELEQVGRGAYTGSVGYLNRDGDMDLNILIRTMVRRGNSIVFRTGAGIVADSDPRRELEETRHKAEGLLRGLRS